MSSSFILCTNVEQVTNSLDTLRHAAFLIVDCEGRQLGCRGGALSLLTIGTPQYSQVFVYDAVQLDQEILAPVLQLLASPDVMKVVWDGRMDFSELCHSYGTKLEHVLDLQIAEVVSRQRRGETEQKRLARLSSYFSAYSVEHFTSRYEELQLVVGMKRCLKEHSLALGDGKDVLIALVKRIHDQNRSDLWMERPLSNNLLNYAAKDIRLIHLVYDHFKTQGYLDDLPALLAQSQRYVTIHVGLKPSHEDYFFRSPVVPLDILQGPSGTLYECHACRRQLSLSCFKKHGPFQRCKMCRACHVLEIKNQVPWKRKENSLIEY